MNKFAILISGLCALGLLGFRDSGDVEKVQEAKSRMGALPRLDAGLWKQLIQKHGWLYGSPKAKIKVLGFLTPNAKLASKNILFGAPSHEGDVIYKTIMMPDSIAKTWNLASKLRIGYAMSEPTKYKAPPIILNAMKQIGEPKFGDFDREFKALPVEIQQKAEVEFDSYKELGKQIKLDTYYLLLPNDEVVEIGHPFNVEKVWNDYLVAKAN
jgi:hypothetical protein